MYRELSESGGHNGKPLAPSTVDTVHRILRLALGDAVNVEQLIAVNPAARAKRPRVAHHEVVDLWTTDQLGTFLAAAERHRLYAFFWLAAYTGARRGELLFLRWSDLDLDNRVVNIMGSESVVDGHQVEGTTKGDRSRVVSIDATTVAVMREHRTRHIAERLRAGAAWVGTDHVFAPETGDLLSPDTPTQLMPKLVESAGLPHARLHDLRHPHATTLLLAKVPVHLVANRLGHRDASVTLRVSAHVLRHDTADIGDVFASAAQKLLLARPLAET